jgi:transcriptional regulator with XRE-family HTH domain
VSGTDNLPNLATLGERMRFCRERANLTQEAIARHFDVSQGAVSHWEKNVSEPSRKRLGEFAILVCCLDIGWLLSGKRYSPEVSIFRPNSVRLFSYREFLDYVSKPEASSGSAAQYLEAHFRSSARTIALRIEDRANAPELEPQDIVFVDPAALPMPNDITVFVVGRPPKIAMGIPRHVVADKFEIVPINAQFPAKTIVKATDLYVGPVVSQSRVRRTEKPQAVVIPMRKLSAGAA